MKKKINLLLILTMIFSFYSCSSMEKKSEKELKKGSNQELKKENGEKKILEKLKADEKKKKIEKESIEVILDKKTIIANNKDKIIYKVKSSKDEVLEKGFEIYINGNKYESKEFKTSEAGEYIIYAKYKNLESEKITITATKSELEVIKLELSKKEIIANNEENITFKITDQENKEINEKFDIYVNNEKYESKEFKTSEAGEYIIYAKYKELESEKITITAIKEILKVNINLDKKKIIANNEDCITFKITDQDNKEINEGFDIYINNEKYESKEFKTLKPGKYTIYVKYKELESEKKTFLVKKIDEISPEIINMSVEKDIVNGEKRIIINIIFSEKIKTEGIEKNIKIYSENKMIDFDVKSEEVKIKIIPKKIKYNTKYLVSIENVLDLYDNKLKNKKEIKYNTKKLIKPELVDIKKGEFEMGDEVGDLWEEHRPVHNVRLTYDFSIGKYEITNTEYNFYLDEIGQKSEEKNKIPKTDITWFDAIKYCNWLSKAQEIPIAYDEKSGKLLDKKGNVTEDIEKVKGYRLPTEAEWEYVARSNDSYRYSGSDNIDEIAFYSENSSFKANKVGQKNKNKFDTYDMSGNVWEWCNDGFSEYKLESLTNPIGDVNSKYKIVRGGSWKSIKYELRNASRDSFYPSIKNNEIGFRIVKNKY